MKSIFKLFFSEIGLGYHSQSWKDYERAKKYIREVSLTSKEYQQVINELCKYLGL